MSKSPFTEWYYANEEYLTSNGVEYSVAELIWDSANAAALHNMVSAIQDGTISIKLSL